MQIAHTGQRESNNLTLLSWLATPFLLPVHPCGGQCIVPAPNLQQKSKGLFWDFFVFFAGKLTIDSHPCKTPVMHGD